MEQKFRNNKEIRSYNSKRFMEFRRSFGDNREEVELASIRLEYPVHVNAEVRLDKDIEYYKTHQKSVTTPLIVQKTDNGFILLAGWKYYHLAHALGQDKVLVLISCFSSRKKMMCEIGCCKPLKVCKITDLKVPAVFDCSFVESTRLEEIKEYDYKHHAQMKPIVVNRDMLITDGYSQYLYNRNMEKEYCEVLVMN